MEWYRITENIFFEVLKSQSLIHYKFQRINSTSTTLTVFSAPVRICCCYEPNTRNSIPLHSNNFATISIRSIHLHAWHYAGNVCVWICGQITKEKFKFWSCSTVVYRNLHLNVLLRICKSGCSNTSLLIHPATQHHTKTKRRLIYVNDTEREWEFRSHGNLNTK